MYWHIDTDIISLLATITLYYYTIRMLPTDRLTGQNRSFVWCLRCGVGMLVVDIASSIIMEVPTSRFSYQLFMTLYLLVVNLAIVSWFLYSLSILYPNQPEQLRRARIVVLTPYALYALLVVSNPFTQIFFSLDQNMNYARSPMFLPLIVGLFMAYALTLFALVFIRRKHIAKGYPFSILWLTPILLGAAIPTQLLNGGWLVLMPMYSVCLLLAFLFIQNLRVRNERAQLKLLTDQVEHFACGLAICQVDAKGRLTVEYLSSGYCVIFEDTCENLMRRYQDDLYSSIHPDDRPHVMRQIEALLKEHNEEEINYRYQTAKGNLKFINVRNEITVHDDGTMTCYSTYTDMTKQITAQQQLRQSEQMLEFATTQAGLEYWRYDPKEDCLYTDSRGQKDYGLEARIPNFVRDKRYAKLLHPDYYEVYEDACRRIRQGEKQVVFEVRGYSPDHSLHWYRYCLTRLQSGENWPDIAVGTALMIDGEKELWAKYELERKKTMLEDDDLLVHAVFNLSTGNTLEYAYRDGSPVPNEDRTIFTYGQQNADLLIDKEERRQFLALNDSETLLARFAQGLTESRFDYRRKLPSGEVRWVRSTMHVVRDPRSNDILLFEYWYDIEEEKMLKLMYRSIASDNYDYVARIDGKSKRFVVFQREKLGENAPPSSGDDADVLTLSGYNDKVHPEDREVTIENMLVANINAHLKASGRYQFSFREMQPDGSVLHKKITQYYIDPMRQIIAMMREDVTELIRNETEKNSLLVDALNAANQASVAKSQFLSRVSHELRTPLNAIIGFLGLAKDADERQTVTYLSNADVAAKQLLAIINDVLDVSAIEAGKMKIAQVPFDFKHLIQSLTNMFVVQCQQKGLGFETKLLSQIDEWLVGDQLRVNQILINLLGNAVKFTSEGHVYLTLCQHEPRKGKVFIRFEVIDTGCGMNEEMLQRLFKPFEQENAIVAQKHGGNGLGLSIVNGLVHMMDGVIRVESKLGKGTKFTVDLPFAKSDKQLTLPPEGVDRLRVLAVDDEEKEREYVSIVLDRIGVAHTCVPDGMTALAELEKAQNGLDPYNICLVDWKMPNMNGIDTVKQIRARYGDDVILIVVSSYEHYQADESIRSAGANLFVSKPLFQSSLFDLFTTLTRGRIAKRDAAKTTIRFEGKRILLAEDNALNRIVAEALIRSRYGMECDCAEDGQIALDRFLASETGYYDAILMDIQMPNMDGYEAARAIRESSHPQGKTIPILALTANAFNEDIAKSLSNGMDAHVAKPIDPSMLADALEKVFMKNSPSSHS